MHVGVATHPGYVRTDNEDGYFASREYTVFAVADGMGGHEHGEVASHLALDAIERHAPIIAQAGPSDLPVRLHEAVQAANTAILSQAEEQDARNRMGTTLVLATICGDRLYFAHIGDSRLYLLRNDVFSQLTRDHSLVQTMVDRGEITPEEAAIHPLRHQITRVVGGDSYISPEIASQALEAGDILLLCTDGLSGVVSTEAMRDLLSSAATPEEKAETLVQAALAAGGPDNITAMVIAYQRPRPLPASPSHTQERRHLLPFWQSLVITLLSLAILLTAGGLWSYTHPQYCVATDKQEMLRLYKHWPLLPMMQRELVTDVSTPAIMLPDVKVQLIEYPDVTTDGIPVAGKDAGVAFLRDLALKTAAVLFEETKTALERHDVIRARQTLEHAKSLGGDPGMVAQLERLVAKQEAKASGK